MSCVFSREGLLIPASQSLISRGQLQAELLFVNVIMFVNATTDVIISHLLTNLGRCQPVDQEIEQG